MDKLDTPNLGIGDHARIALQRRLFAQVAKNRRTRALMKNLLVPADLPLLEHDRLGDGHGAGLTGFLKRLAKRQEQHMELWRHHLVKCGELLQPAPWKWPYESLTAAGWFPHPRQQVIPRAQGIRSVAMTRLLLERQAETYSLFAEACREQDESVCPLTEQLLRGLEETVAELAALGEELSRGELRDYSRYVAHRAWEALYWWTRGTGDYIRLLIQDPDFADRTFWNTLLRIATPARDPEVFRAPAVEEFDASSWRWKLDRITWGLGRRLFSPPVHDVAGGIATGRVSVELPADEVFARGVYFERWHLFHLNMWNVSLAEPNEKVGNTLRIRLKGGGQISAEVLEWDEKRRHLALEAIDLPFPFWSARIDISVSELGPYRSELINMMTYRLRKSPVSTVLTVVLGSGLEKGVEQYLNQALRRFKMLAENVASTGRALVPPGAGTVVPPPALDLKAESLMEHSA